MSPHPHLPLPSDPKSSAPSPVAGSSSGPINLLAEVALQGGSRSASALSASSGDRFLSNPRTTPAPFVTIGRQISALLDTPMSPLDRSPDLHEGQHHQLQHQQPHIPSPPGHQEYSSSSRLHSGRSGNEAQGGSVDRDRYPLPSMSAQQLPSHRSPSSKQLIPGVSPRLPPRHEQELCIHDQQPPQQQVHQAYQHQHQHRQHQHPSQQRSYTPAASSSRGLSSTPQPAQEPTRPGNPRLYTYPDHQFSSSAPYGYSVHSDERWRQVQSPSVGFPFPPHQTLARRAPTGPNGSCFPPGIQSSQSGASRNAAPREANISLPVSQSSTASDRIRHFGEATSSLKGVPHSTEESGAGATATHGVHSRNNTVPSSRPLLSPRVTLLSPAPPKSTPWRNRPAAAPEPANMLGTDVPSGLSHDRHFRFVNHGPGDPAQRRRNYATPLGVPALNENSGSVLSGSGVPRQISPLPPGARGVSEGGQPGRLASVTASDPDHYLQSGSRKINHIDEEVPTDSELSELGDKEDSDDFGSEGYDDNDVDYLPGSHTPRKRKATRPPSSSPGHHRGSSATRSSARLRGLKKDQERTRRASSELQEVDQFDLHSQPESTAAAALREMSAGGINLYAHQSDGDDKNRKPKKRTYIRRDAQRRKEQNAQAQKKFRLKKKRIAEDMRLELEQCKRQIASLHSELEAARRAHAHQTNLNTAARLAISKLNRTILGCDGCTLKKKEWEASEAESRAIMALEMARHGGEGDGDESDDDSNDEEGGKAAPRRQSN